MDHEVLDWILASDNWESENKPNTSIRPKPECLSTVSNASVMDVVDVTSSSTRRIREVSEGIRVLRRSALRAVATTRCVGCAAMSLAKLRPRPDEQPVMSHTASSGRVYIGLWAFVIVAREDGLWGRVTNRIPEDDVRARYLGWIKVFRDHLRGRMVRYFIGFHF